MQLDDIFRRDPSEVDPPADWLDNRGTKFYVRSGRFSLVLAAYAGPIHASCLFVGRAIDGKRVHLLGDSIEVSESGEFNGGDIILRRETCKFLRNKCGIGEQLLNAFIAQELSDQGED